MPAHSSIRRVHFLQHTSAFAGIALVDGARPVRAADLKPVRVAVAPSDGVTSVLYAKRAGLFEKAGLDVTLEIQRNGSAVAAAILSNTYDIGNSSVTSVFLAHEKNLPFTLVAPAGVYDAKSPPYGGAITLKNSPLKFDKDVNGEIFGTASLGGIGHDAFCGWVEQHGGDARLLRFTEVPFSLAPAAIEQHRVVAAEIATPVLTTAMDTGDFRIVPIYNAIAPLFMVSAWFTSRQFSAANPDVVRTFARVVADSAAYVNAHHAETAAVVAEFTSVPMSQVQRMPRSVQGSRLDPALIQPAIDAAAKYGSLKASFPAVDLIDPVIAR
jgi:NitT/TauT family transport system substrate-binding protein